MNIYIDSEKTKKFIEKKYNTKVNLYSVYDTKKKFFNSPLWFDMYRPDEEVIHGSKLKITNE